MMASSKQRGPFLCVTAWEDIPLNRLLCCRHARWHNAAVALDLWQRELPFPGAQAAMSLPEAAAACLCQWQRLCVAQRPRPDSAAAAAGLGEAVQVELR